MLPKRIILHTCLFRISFSLTIGHPFRSKALPSSDVLSLKPAASSSENCDTFVVQYPNIQRNACEAMSERNPVSAEGDGGRKPLPPLKPRIRSGLSAPRRSLHGALSTGPNPVRRPPLANPRQNLHLLKKNIAHVPTSNRSTVPKSVQQPSPRDEETAYFAVLYTKRSKKKHKTYQDGYIVLKSDRKVELQDEDGKKISSANFGKPLGGLKDGNTLEIGTFELEVQASVDADTYLSGRLFLQHSLPDPVVPSTRRKKTPAKLLSKFKPLRAKNASSDGKPKSEMDPLHDPNAPNAIVLQASYTNANGKKTAPVVLDPYLAKRMRPHQREGVKFLYRCVEGAAELGESNTQGAILADSMGLGKSLQSIAIVWTLLKQGSNGKPLAKKAIIVCPASLVQNWMNEVKKWLGFERLKPVALMSGKSTYESKESIADFLHGNLSKLLVISYEMFRSYASDLYKVNCGILICDEGHRLKSSGGNKTISALSKIPCRRRVILTGTPVQNDLEEFFAMCNFVNPGALGTLTSFRTVFAGPILASRDTNTSAEAVALGKARASELHKQAAKFVLRRTSDILEKYLPPKMETAVFCHLSDSQAFIYTNECEQFFTATTDMSNTAAALQVINRLRKVCSHPALLNGNESDDESEANAPLSQEQKEDYEASSKMSITMSICKASIDVGDRLVVVSNFTSTLDVLEEALRACDISFCRLDGSTPAQSRGDLVRIFNDGRNGDKVFLLSAKAGGVGLNIVGANRLILYDPDWNPATDLQAMARIWRDGQSKSVYVYRLLCTGTIEEKIFQRQLFKGELQIAIEASDETGEGGTSFAQKLAADHAKGINFSASELRNLFKYAGNQTELCDTLAVLERSREDAQRGAEDENDVSMGGDLLVAFTRYRAQLEALAPVTGVVLCDKDDVLSTALNGTENAAGIVSYLYTTRSGDRKAGKRKAPPSNVVKKPKKKKVTVKRPIIADSDSDASDDDLDDLINGMGASKLLNDMKSNYQKRTIVDLCNQENSVLQMPHRLDSTAKEARIEHNSAGVSVSAPEKCGGTTPELGILDDSAEMRNPKKGSGLTWDEALNVIDDDISF